MKYVIRFQRTYREAGTLISDFDSATVTEARKQLREAYRQSTRNCRYWIEAVDTADDALGLKNMLSMPTEKIGMRMVGQI